MTGNNIYFKFFSVPLKYAGRGGFYSLNAGWRESVKIRQE